MPRSSPLSSIAALLRLALLAAVLAVAGLSSAVQAQTDGELDPSFWSDGRVALATPPYFGGVNATVVGPDGRLVIVGRRSDGPPYNLFWANLDDDVLGTPCIPNAPGGGNLFYPTDATFDPEGRLLIVGFAEFPTAGREGFAMRFLYPACDLDETFNTDGLYRTNLNEAEIHAIGTDSTSRVVLVGRSHDAGGEHKLLVVRLGAPRLLDLGFADFGLFELDLAEPIQGQAVAVQSDDRIVVGATRSAASGAFDDFFLARLDLAGELDSSFAAGGTLQLDLQEDQYDVLLDLLVDPVDGDIVAAGTSGTSASLQFAAVRLDATGELDASFSGDGIWIGALLDLDVCYQLERQSDGKILLAGTVYNPGTSVADFAVVRLLPNGDPDPAFGSLGVSRVSFDLEPNEHDQLLSATLHAGKLVVAGTAQDWDGSLGDRPVVARLFSDPLVFADGFERASAGAWSSAAGAP